MNFQDYNALGQVINDGWGQTSEKEPGTFKIIARITGENKMCITCMVVVNLLNRQEMQKECDKAYQQCKKAADAALKEIKKDFKTIAGRALKTKQAGNDESVELINMSAYSPKGTALVRCVYHFNVE